MNKPTYSELLSIIQPRPIRNDKQLAFYQGYLDNLLDKMELNQNEIDLRDMLGILISEYESKNPLPDAKPHEVIQHLLEEQRKTVDDLLAVFNGNARDWGFVLTGRSIPSRQEAKKLGEFFGVSPDLFKSS